MPVAAQMLEGLVTDAESGAVLPGVVVINKTHERSSFSDVNGNFSIAAQKGDEIEFTYLGYAPGSMQMPEQGRVYRKVSLRKQLFSLDEVVIGPQYTPYQLDSIKRRQTYHAALSREKMSSSVLGSIFSPASALAEQFNKSSKQIYRFQKNYVKWEDQKFVDTRYTPEEVAQLTGLKGDTLGAFMSAYPMPADYARAATDLEIKMWIKYNYKEWMKHPVMPPKIDMPDTNEDSLRRKP